MKKILSSLSFLWRWALPKRRRVISRDGFVLVASTHAPRSKPISFFEHEEIALTRGPEGKTVRFTQCGHDRPCMFEISIYGCVRSLKIESIKNGEVNTLCPDCFLALVREHAIRCCMCGGPILPGDGVALYDKRSGGIRKEAATFVDEKAAAIGCMRWDCCPSGGFFAGDWTKDGFRPAFGGGTAAGEAMRTGQVVVNKEKQ